MYSALKFIADELNNNSTITDEFPSSSNISGFNIFPGIADSETEGSFLVFMVRRNGRFTKDRLNAYECEISVFSDSIMQAAQKADIVEEELTNNVKIYGRASDVQITEDQTKAYINLIFTFKL